MPTLHKMDCAADWGTTAGRITPLNECLAEAGLRAAGAFRHPAAFLHAAAAAATPMFREVMGLDRK